MTIARRRTAIFVHGCFWHGCPRHYRQPKTRLDYWIPKLARNKARDHMVKRQLTKQGWRVITIWECQVKKDPAAVARRIRLLVRSRNWPPKPLRCGACQQE